MNRKNAIFIAATGQNVGKTTVCLGILAGLQKRFSSVGFIKPVGQQHVRTTEGVDADKDVVLFKEHFHLQTSYQTMSPVLCPTGFTRDFLDNKVDEKGLFKKITSSFDSIAKEHPYVLVEGTGHVGVGSIFNVNNAQVAQALQMDVVLIATGGLGSAIDELALNIELCKKYGVTVRGVIVNRVLNDKRSMIEEYFPKALKRWDIPLLGLIPYLPYLSIPMMKDFEGLLKAPLISGERYRLRHFTKIRLVASSLDSYMKEIAPNELIITPACREDIILATLNNEHLETGMILTGQIAPRPELIERIKKTNIPILYAPFCSFDMMKMISTFSAKIQKDDLPKIKQAIDLVEQHLDFQRLCGL
ncbi:MAG: hypothetical protein JWO53_895 [Chlamydiia bacterium]|nr:hypothetical protein [Chlamydiia bacterium]